MRCIMANKYFIDSNENYQQRQVCMMKKNYYYVVRAFSAIIGSLNNTNSLVGGDYRPALLAGKLPKTDDVSDVNTNNLGEKLKFLTIALSDKRHPENVNTFKESAIYKIILTHLFSGCITDVDQQWDNFVLKNSQDSPFKDKNALTAALICQRDSTNSPIGLDFSKLIDTLVQTDKNGNYFLSNDIDINDEIALTEAVKMYLTMLKSNKRFTENYQNPKLGAFSDEDELF